MNLIKKTNNKTPLFPYFLNRGKTYIIVFLSLIYSKTLLAQLTIPDKLTVNDINSIIKNCDELPKDKDYKFYVNILNTLNKLEKKIELLNDNEIKLNFYKRAADLLYYNYDYTKALDYTNKGFEILKHYDDKRFLGLFYESRGLIYRSQNKLEQSISALFISEKFINNYGKTEEKVDCNINFAIINRDKHNWEETIKYCNLANTELAKLPKDIGKETYVNLFLAEGYTELNKIDEAKKHFILVENNLNKIYFDEAFFGKYFHSKGVYCLKINEYQNAISYFNKSNSCIKKMFDIRNNTVNQFLNIKSELTYNEFKNEKTKSDLEQSKKDIQYINNILILSILFIFILIIIVVFQNKSMKFKTKMNSLLKENNVETRKVNKKIKKAHKSRNDFLDTITHELRTPLNTIKGTTYLMKNNSSEINKKEYSETLVFSTNHLLNLINNMIEFNNLDLTNKQELFCKKVNLNELVSSTFNLYKIKNINNNNFNNFEIELDSSISKELMIDESRLTQVFINILDNAVKFTKNGTIRIKTKLLKDYNNKQKIKFTFEDTGIGINKNIQKNVFDLFFQGSKEINREYGGCGIGLSIVKKTIDLFGGEIQMSSEEKKGTTIKLIIDFEKV